MKSIETKSLSVGMVKDVHPLQQPEGSYPFALNAILESRGGDHPFIVNEGGNIQCASLANNAIVIGHTLTDTDNIILFISLDDETSSMIAEYNPNSCTITTIIESADLNFSIKYPIKALFRIRKGCQRTVYFTDGNNPYRVINIDDIAQYGSPFDVKRLDLSREVTIPKMLYVKTLNSGGNTKVGTYQFFIRYLDKDLNSTPWLNTVLPIPIYDENVPSGTLPSYDKIDGAIPIIDQEGVEGAVPATTKSIQFTLTDLDTTFEYYQIGVIASNSTLNQASSAYILPEIDISGTSDTYIFTGESTDNILTTVGDFIVEPLRVDKVGSHSQLDNRLYLGNLKYDGYDWSAVQQAANNIEIKWVASTISTMSAVPGAETSGKGEPGSYYATRKSYLRDEVYAFGIRGRYKTGHVTPVFHIPGREAVASDTTSLTVVVTPTISTEVAEADVKHLGLTVGQTVPKWKVYNTAENLNRTMSYYEVNKEYPNILDCEGNRVYPTGNIRHHKFPDNNIFPFVNDTGLSVYEFSALGIDVDLTSFISNLPAELQNEIIDWEIVRGKRDSYNRTITDKGYIHNAYTGHGVFPIVDTSDAYISDSFQAKDPLHTPQDQKFYYWSPATLLKRQYPDGAYISTEIQFEDTPFFSPYGTYNILDIDTTETYNRTIREGKFINRYKELDGLPVGDLNVNIPPVKESVGSADFLNYNWSVDNFGLVIEDPYTYINDPATAEIKSTYVSFKNNRDVYTNLENIVYQDIGDKQGTWYFGGDIFICTMTFRLGDIDDAQYTDMKAFYESEINANLRHGKESYVSEYRTYLEEVNDNGDTIWVNPEYLAYNDDYSKQSTEIVYFPLSNSFDFCLDCRDDKPYRIVASEKSTQEEISDNYRNFLANNYLDINADSGGITELIVNNDNLYVFTPNYPIFVPTRPQSIQTNESVAYVGTGDIFSVPYKKLTSAPYKYSGCNDFKSIQSTEFGVFYVDSINGAVHLLTDNAREITQGMHNWFEENIPYNIDQQLETLGYPKFKFKQASNGIGITSTYDQRHRRYLFTKLDYKIIDEENFGGIASYGDVTQTSSKLYLDNNKGIFWYLAPLNIYDKVDLNDETYFENKSFTLSYSPLHEKWVSYHSYMPNYYINDGNNFWSSINSNSNIWRHNYEGAYQRYYGVKHDHILDMIFNENPLQVKTFAALEFKCDSVLDNVSTNKFFDRVIFYNSYQSSGLKNILLKESTFDIFNTSSSVSVEKVQNGWRMNDIRNYADSDLPLWSTDWTDLLSNYYIDHVPNPVAIDLTTSEFELSRLRDAWFGVRVFSNHADNIKLNTNIVTTQQRISYR